MSLTGGTDVAEQEKRTIRRAVSRARARLARAAGRELLRRRAFWAVLTAAVVGAARPLYWPLGFEAPLWAGAVAALAVMALLSIVGLVALLLLGRRNRPSELASARAIDEVLGLKEVVASGFAFERDERGEVLEQMTRERALEEVSDFRPERSFSLPTVRPRPKSLALVCGIAVLVALIGSYHPALASILASPPTENELHAAARLESFARELEQGRAADERDERRERNVDHQDPDESSGVSRSKAQRELASKARKAARAARRGDREAAMRELDNLRRDANKATKESAELRSALRQIAAALRVRPPRGSKAKSGSAEERASAGREGSKSGGSKSEKAALAAKQKAAEALRALARKLGSPEKGREGDGRAKAAAERQLLEKLARAVAHSESLASGSGAKRELAKRLSEALAKAGEALGSGDREEAARRLEEAAQRASELEAARTSAEREAEAIARLLKASGALGRAVQMALSGKAGRGGEKGMSMGMAMMGSGSGEKGLGMGEGEGEGQGGKGGRGRASSTALARALALRLAALGMGGATGLPGTGPEGHADNWGRPNSGLPVKGSSRVRAQVSEGEMAVTAIQGMGRNAEPTKEYRSVYPTYAALAEEAIGEEVVPAAQRQVVRRYFEAIRPGGGDTEAAPGASDDEEIEEIEEVTESEPAAPVEAGQ